MKIKKMLCILLSLACCLSTTAFATNEMEIATAPQEVDNHSRWVVDHFFQYDYTLWDEEGNDITTEFYQAMTPVYEAGDYGTIIDYIENNVSHGEATKIDPISPQSVTSDAVRVTKYQFDDQALTELNTGWENHNRAFCIVELVYMYDEINDKITRVVSCDLATDYDEDNGFWLERTYNDADDPKPWPTITNKRTKLASSGAYFTYSFHFDLKIRVLTDPYTSILTYHYAGDFSFRQNAEP